MNGEALRKVMRIFPQGVVVVTADPGGTPRGITVSSFISVSLEPPLVLASITRSARAHEAIESAGAFAVNILAEEQGPLSEHFARPDLPSEEQFHDISYRPGKTGSPLIEGCLGFLDCRLVAAPAQADHTLFIGEVEEGDIIREGRPLIFYGRHYWGLSGEVHRRE